MTHKTLDQILAEVEGWHKRHPWKSRWYTVRSWLKDVWDLRLEPRRRWQRATRGYSYYDWWSFDTYISGVIGKAVLDFRYDSHGHPGDMTEEEWNDILDRIYIPLIRYSDDKFSVLPWQEQKELYEEACEAMKLFGEYLGGMWD